MNMAVAKAAPPLVLCLGLPGSASTWVYNICIHLSGLRPPHQVSMGFCDDLADLLSKIGDVDPASNALVIKSHCADAGMCDFMTANLARPVLSIRDPRDCIVSKMERFDESFEDALARVRASCDAVLRLWRPGVPLLRYEDGFFHSPQVLAALQNYLAPGQRVDLAALGRAYSQEAIMQFIGGLDQIDPGRLATYGDDAVDVVTHWHRNHFGDGLCNKWRTRLTAEQKALANDLLAPALAAFGYVDQAPDRSLGGKSFVISA